MPMGHRICDSKLQLPFLFYIVNSRYSKLFNIVNRNLRLVGLIVANCDFYLVFGGLDGCISCSILCLH